MLKKNPQFEFTTIVIMFICMAFTTFIFYSITQVNTYPEFVENDTVAAERSGYQTVVDNTTSGTSSYQSIINFILSVAGLSAAAGVLGFIIGTAIFPNPYIVFASAVLVFYPFINLIVQVLSSGTGIPIEITGFLAAVFTLIAGIALISWYKGQSGTI